MDSYFSTSKWYYFQDDFFLKVNYLFYLFIFGCVGSSLLRVAFSLVAANRLLFLVVLGLLIAVASLVAEHGL